MHGLLGYMLAQASIITNDCFAQAAGKVFELHRVEFTILQLVSENAPVTPGKLAKSLAMTAPGVTIWLDRLEARALIRRERSDTDRRVQHLGVTAAGRELVAQALAALLQAERRVLAGLSAGERQMLLELLHKVARGRQR